MTEPHKRMSGPKKCKKCRFWGAFFLPFVCSKRGGEGNGFEGHFCKQILGQWPYIFIYTHNFDCRGINLCNACVSLVSVCLASIISQKGNHTTIMLGELISNYTHTSYTTIIVG